MSSPSELSSLDVLLPIVAPLPVDEVAERREQWLKALQNVGDVHQAVLSGQDAVRRLATRFGCRRSGAKLLSTTGSTSAWVPALEECGEAFVEECARLVELRGGSSSECAASHVLSCAVRLAEALGQTGPLLTSLEKELAFVGERTEQLEALYEVVLKRVQSLAGHVPFLEQSLSEAKTVEEALRVERKELQQSLKAAEQKYVQSEREKTNLRKAHEQTLGDLDAAKRSTRLRRTPTPATASGWTSGGWSDGASPQRRSMASTAAQTGDGTAQHHHHHRRSPIDQTEFVEPSGTLQPPVNDPRQADDHLQCKDLFSKHEHNHIELLSATADTERDAIAGVHTASAGECSPAVTHALPQAGYLQPVLRHCLSESDSVGLPWTSATPTTAATLMASPISQEASVSVSATPSPTLQPPILHTSERRPSASMATDSAPCRSMIPVPARSKLHSDAGLRNANLLMSNEPRPRVHTAPSPRASVSNSERCAATLSTGNLLSASYERSPKSLKSSEGDKGSSCTSSSGSARPNAAPAVSLLERGSMWALALKQLKQNDPLSASAAAAFMHLAALAREAQDRHPSSRPPRSSPRDPDELCALRPTAGLKWVADCVSQWAENDLGVLDYALATSIKHAAVNLRSLVRLLS